MTPDAPSPYRQVMGQAFAALPPSLQAFHSGTGPRRWSGTADVRRGTGWAARRLADLFGFPAAGTGLPLTVTIERRGNRERWTRDFAGTVLASDQWADRDRALLFERFGPATFGCALSWKGNRQGEGSRLVVVPRRWFLLGLPMPRLLLPAGPAFEHECDGCFAFDIELSLPLIGLVVAYRGQLRPALC